jgi:hypothetical protein
LEGLSGQSFKRSDKYVAPTNLRCEPVSANDGFCAEDADCGTGLTCHWVFAGGTIEFNPVWELRCNTGSPDGSHCLSARDCTNQSCIESTCRSACKSDAECDADSWCNTLCRPGHRKCGSDSECRSGTVCRPFSRDDDANFYDIDSNAYLPDGKACLPPSGTGQSCAKDSDCASGLLCQANGCAMIQP